MGAGGSVNSANSSIGSPDGRPKGQRNSVRQYPTYEVSFHSAENFKFAEELPAKFILRISYESLDFVNIQTNSPIIQFPFQHIICWGSGPYNFRFHLFDFENKERLPTSSSSSAANSKREGDSKTGEEDNEGKPTAAEGETGDSNGERDGGNKDISIVLRTNEGASIEENIMKIVRMLMVDIEKKAVSKEEFNALITTIYDIDRGQLQENWFHYLDQFSTGRTFLAKQCMDLMLLIGPLAPFEKVDLACLLYQRILTTESFQLVVNAFDDKAERENLIHRLGLKNVSSEFELVTDCKILPSHVTIPSTPGSPTRKVTPLAKPSPKADSLDGSTAGTVGSINGRSVSNSSTIASPSSIPSRKSTVAKSPTAAIEGNDYNNSSSNNNSNIRMSTTSASIDDTETGV